MSPAQLTLDLLESLLAVNGATGWKGVYATVPNTIDKVVTVFDTDPQLDFRRMRTPYTHEKHHGVMIHVRAKEYQTGWDKAVALCALLGTVVHRPEAGIGGGAGSKFVGYYLKSGPSPAGIPREETNVRYMFSANYTTVIEAL